MAADLAARWAGETAAARAETKAVKRAVDWAVQWADLSGNLWAENLVVGTAERTAVRMADLRAR